MSDELLTLSELADLYRCSRSGFGLRFGHLSIGKQQKPDKIPNSHTFTSEFESGPGHH